MRLITNPVITQIEKPLLYYDPRSVSGLVLWLDPNEMNSYYNDGDGLEYWYDKSGYNHHASQSNASYRPTIRKNAMGQNTMLDMYYTGSQYMTIARTATLESNNITIFTVHIYWGGNASAYILSKPYRTTGYTTPYSQYAIHATYSTTTGRYGGHVGLSATVIKQWYTSNLFTVYSPEIICTIYDGTAAARQYVNNYPQTLTYALGAANTGNIDYSGGTTNLCLFATSSYSLSQYFSGYIGDILIYNSALSESNRAFVQNYLFAKYNLPSINASGVP